MFVKNNDLRITMLENRITLLKERSGVENGNIIKKLERQLRKIKAGA